MDTYDCSICCNELPKIIKKKPNGIECPQCNNQFCLNCQRTYAKGDCMNCHMEFKSKFIIEHLGKTFIDKVLKPKIIADLMVEQKEGLKYVQPLVEWERELRKQKKNARFGISITIPDRPSISKTNINQIFPCPSTNCRGFVESGLCGVCHMDICVRCREIQKENHVCNVETLQSIAALSMDSKSCPKCCAIIHRTEGCNHMFCTNCRTHFDWVSGNILKTSTNGHYLHLQQFSQNVAIRQVANDENTDCNETGFSIFRDRISLDNIDKEKLPIELIHSLWIDSNSIRLAKRKLYNEPTIQAETAESLEELQVKYLLADINEEQWSRQVYQVVRKKTLGLLYAEVFNIYLETVDNLQTACVGPTPDIDSIVYNYTKLVELCNESFISIADEYGGVIHHFRDYCASINDAPFI